MDSTDTGSTGNAATTVSQWEQWFANVQHKAPLYFNVTVPYNRKNKGNDFYHAKDYKAAVESYSKSMQELDSNETVSAVTSASLLLNRAAALLMLLQYREALSDCEKAISLDSSNSKAHFRKATSLKGLGRLEDAVRVLNIGLALDPKSGTALMEKDALNKAILQLSEAKQLMKERKFRLALNKSDELSRAIGAGSNSREVSLLRLEALLELTRVEEAYNLSNSMVRSM